MILIIGLGNPGKKFQKTRHNIGFLILSAFKRKNDFSNWYDKTKLRAKISKGKIGREKIILAKPQTFMNDSGDSVKYLISYYKLKIKDLIVIHDDLDISIGKIKISKTRGSAGHNGVQSIIDQTNSKDFIRIRIGIKPTVYPVPDGNSAIFVLKEFTKKEQEILKQVKKIVCEAIEITAKNKVEKAMNKFN